MRKTVMMMMTMSRLTRHEDNDDVDDDDVNDQVDWTQGRRDLCQSEGIHPGQWKQVSW